MSDHTSRITEEMLLQAVKETGITPITGEMYEVVDGKECACGMGIFYYSKGVRINQRNPEIGVNEPFWKEAENELGSGYVRGYYLGFDDNPLGSADNYFDNGREKLGYEDGKSGREALIKAGYIFAKQ